MRCENIDSHDTPSPVPRVTIARSTPSQAIATDDGS